MVATAAAVTVATAAAVATAAGEVRNEADAPTVAAEGTAPPAVATAVAVVGIDRWNKCIDHRHERKYCF